MLLPLAHLLHKAKERGYAIPAFNVFNLETVQAVMHAAQKESSPVILQTSPAAVAYAGLETIASIVHLQAHTTRIPVVLHLDHGKDPNLVERVIASKLYTSVMYDGSALPFEENLANTKRLTTLAHKHGVSIEAELGAIPGKEDLVDVKRRDAFYTDPEQAIQFVKKTGIDALAISVGTAHGAYKYKGACKLDYDRIEAIADGVDVPLVLHGASSIPEKIKNLCLSLGCEIEDAKGVTDVAVRKAIAHGISKVNIDTDLRIAFDAGLRRYLKEHPEVIDPRAFLSEAVVLMSSVARQKMEVFGSKGRA